MGMRLRTVLAPCVTLAGIAVLVVGIALIYLPAALIVCGLAVGALGLLLVPASAKAKQ